MVFDFFKKFGGKKRPKDNSDRNEVIRRVVAAAADDTRKRDEPTPPPAEAVESAGLVGPAAAVAEPPRKTAPGKAAADAADIPPEKIAQRAYEVWVRKGRPVGTADQDWLQAEAELRAEMLYRPADSDPLPMKPR